MGNLIKISQHSFIQSTYLIIACIQEPKLDGSVVIWLAHELDTSVKIWISHELDGGVVIWLAH